MRFLKYGLAFIIALFLALPSSSYATEFVIEGIGESSQSQINSSESSQNTSSQQNTQSTDNQVSEEASTGSNSTDQNTGGDSSIKTGDTNSDTSVKNTGNASVLEQECCPTQPSIAQISGNGSDSNNSIDASSNNQTNVYQKNDAKVTNNVHGQANTGYNSASKNSGDVSVDTGDINARVGVDNQFNFTYARVFTQNSSFDLKISGNASDSENNALFAYFNVLNIYQHNETDIINDLFWEINTGGNTTNKNSGLVNLKTGDVLIDIFVKNKVNKNVAIVECCELAKASPTPAPTPGSTSPPTPGPEGGSGGNGGGGAGGGGGPGGAGGPGGGQVLGVVLPETGSTIFWWLTLFALILLRMGLFLKSKQSDRLFKSLKLFNSSFNYAKV